MKHNLKADDDVIIKGESGSFKGIVVKTTRHNVVVQLANFPTSTPIPFQIGKVKKIKDYENTDVKFRVNGIFGEGRVLVATKEGCLVKTPDGEEFNISWSCVFD